MCSEIDASLGAAIGTLNKNTFAQIITRTDSWNLLTNSYLRKAELAVRDFCKSGNKSGHQAHTLLMSSRGFTSSPLLSWWIFQVAFWLVSALLVLSVQWPKTKPRADDAFLQKRLRDYYGKGKLGKSEQRAALSILCPHILSPFIQLRRRTLKQRLGSKLCHITGLECTLFL